jgi:hypothetical protein
MSRDTLQSNICYDKDYEKEYVNRCAASYAAKILKADVKSKKRKAIVIDAPRDISSDREELMLYFAARHSGLVSWAMARNRDITDALYCDEGSGLFWKESTHFRKIRKMYRIKGSICKYIKPPSGDRDYDGHDRCYEAQKSKSPLSKVIGGVIGVKDFQWKVKEIDEDMASDTVNHKHDYGWGFSYVCVWERNYRAEHFRSLRPIKVRLAVFKHEMQGRANRKAQLEKYQWT